MANEREAVEAYRDLIKQLSKLGAVNLIQEIESTVGRGTVRKREDERYGGKRSEEFASREPFSPTERYILAVRLVLSALDPLFMAADAREQLASFVEDSEPELTWELDQLEPVEGTGQELIPDTSPGEAIEKIPELTSDEKELRTEAQNISKLCDELLKES